MAKTPTLAELASWSPGIYAHGKKAFMAGVARSNNPYAGNKSVRGRECFDTWQAGYDGEIIDRLIAYLVDIAA